MSVQFKFLTTDMLKKEVTRFLEIGWTTEEILGSSQNISGPMLPHAHWLSLVLFREVKRPGHEADNSLPLKVKCA